MRHQHTRLLAVAIVLVSVAGVACAALTTDEAAALVRDTTGATVSDSAVEVRDDDGLQTAFILGATPDGHAARFAVRLDSGTFRGFTLTDPPVATRGSRLTPAEAERICETMAEDYLGGLPEELVWRTELVTDDEIRLTSHVPENAVLSGVAVPYVRAAFDRLSGVATSYYQRPGEPAPDGVVEDVSSEDAARIALDHYGEGGAVVGEPTPGRFEGRLLWNVTVSGPRPEAWYTISGSTGVIEHVSVADEEPLSARPDLAHPIAANGKSAPTGYWPPPRLLLAGGVVLLAAGVGLVFLRRRR